MSLSILSSSDLTSVFVVLCLQIVLYVLHFQDHFHPQDWLSDSDLSSVSVMEDQLGWNPCDNVLLEVMSEILD